MTTKKILFAIIILGILGAGVFVYLKEGVTPKQSNQESIRQRDISEIEKFAENQKLSDLRSKLVTRVVFVPGRIINFVV